MVCYREHDLSISSSLTQESVKLCVEADIAVPWLIRERADQRGLKKLSRECLRAVGHAYAQQGRSKRYRGTVSCMSFSDFEQSLRRGTQNEKERDWIRAQFYAAK